MPIITNQGLKTISNAFNCLEIPDHRARANNCFVGLLAVNDTFKYGKSLAAEQLEWLTDEIEDKKQAMYPDRYTDLSTPFLLEELARLGREKEVATAFLRMCEQIEKDTAAKLPASALQEHDYHSDNFQGM